MTKGIILTIFVTAWIVLIISTNCNVIEWKTYINETVAETNSSILEEIYSETNATESEYERLESSLNDIQPDKIGPEKAKGKPELGAIPFRERTSSIPETTTYWTYAPLAPVKLSKIQWPSGTPSKDNEKICHLPADGGPCDISYSAWYYNSSSMTCQWFRYTGCMGNANRFSSRLNCQYFCIDNVNDVCKSVDCMKDFECIAMRDESCVNNVGEDNDPDVVCPPQQPICTYHGIKLQPDYNRTWKHPAECLEPPDQGSCMKRTTPEKRYFYDRASNDCSLFYFSGCGGGNNRFMEKAECMNHCAV